MGFHTWTESKIAMFEARHPIGSKARLALALLLYTAQRRSDVGCQHIRDGVVHVRQQKTGATLAIPLHPGPRRHHRGQSERTPHLPYDELWEKFHSRRLWELVPQCNEAGLPKRCSAHGLRKAACRRLAEAWMQRKRHCGYQRSLHFY
jgi:hypothetical protein